MPELKKITVDLSGPKRKKRAPFSDFSTVCNSLHASLKHVARCVGAKAPEFAVSDLHMGSAVMAIEPESSTNGVGGIVSLFIETITSLENGAPIDSRLDAAALHCFNGFSGVARKRDVTLKIGRVLLTEQYANYLSSLLDPSSTSTGSVSGRLEAFTVHNQKKFTLYPPIPGEEIDCIFDESDLPRVLDAVPKQVTVYGTLHFSKSKIFPVRVDVEEFVIEESSDRLPTLLDAQGILPPLTPNQLLNPNFSDEWY